MCEYKIGWIYACMYFTYCESHPFRTFGGISLLLFSSPFPPPRKNKFTDVDSSASQVLAYRGTSSRVLSYVYPAFNRRRRRRRYFTPLPSPSLSFSLRSLSRYLYGELRYSPESREQLSGRRHSYLLGRRRSGDLNDIRARARACVCERKISFSVISFHKLP